MEINNENKAKFFALYWGQEVLFDHPAKLGPYPINNSRNWSHEAHQLYLKPLSQISDEDKDHAYVPVYPTHVCVVNIDYLRSKGYALPWMGLSVNAMIEAGWIKSQIANPKSEISHV